MKKEKDIEDENPLGKRFLTKLEHGPDVHEAETSDVRRISMIENAHDLFPRQFQGIELKKKAVGG